MEEGTKMATKRYKALPNRRRLHKEKSGSGFRASCASWRLSFFVVLLFGTSTAVARDYRVDSQKKFDAISQIEMQQGDAILLKCGMRFNGTQSYTFCWGMGGENQRFDDMDHLAVGDLK
jgi:hypothetical protein